MEVVASCCGPAFLQQGQGSFSELMDTRLAWVENLLEVATD